MSDSCDELTCPEHGEENRRRAQEESLGTFRGVFIALGLALLGWLILVGVTYALAWWVIQ